MHMYAKLQQDGFQIKGLVLIDDLAIDIVKEFIYLIGTSPKLLSLKEFEIKQTTNSQTILMIWFLGFLFSKQQTN